MLSETDEKKPPSFTSINLIFLLLVCFNTNFLLSEREICTANIGPRSFFVSRCLLKLFSLLLLLEEECCENNLSPCPGKTATPVQDKISNEISNMKLASLTASKNTGLFLVKPEKNKELKKSINIKEMQLKRSELTKKVDSQ